MFGIGFSELILVLLVIIILVHPKDLPTFVRKIGRLYGRFTALRDGFVAEVREMEREIRINEDASDGKTVPGTGNGAEAPAVAVAMDDKRPPAQPQAQPGSEETDNKEKLI